jgi:predicted HTH transcriptional regulator
MQIGAKNYIVKDKFTTTELFDKIDKALKEATFTLIKNGETEKVEFKSTLRYDFVHHGANKELSKVMARSISGFLNSDGGNLFIGIADNGEPIGIENDIKVLTKQNDDGFLSTLYQIVIDYIGTDFCHKVHPNILELENKKICSIKIDPSDKPAWFHDGRSEELFIRAGQSTRALDAKEAVEYVFERFKKNDF